MTEVIVAYDISRDDRRARVAAYVSKFGVRLQRSVFQCQLRSEQVDEVMAAIEQMIDLDTDVVHMFPRCGVCRDGSRTLGQAPPDLNIRYWVV